MPLLPAVVLRSGFAAGMVIEAPFSVQKGPSTIGPFKGGGVILCACLDSRGTFFLSANKEICDDYDA